MDPNETLKQLRIALRNGDLSDAKVDKLNFYMDASELFEALDTWLSSGGFLPDDWAQR